MAGLNLSLLRLVAQESHNFPNLVFYAIERNKRNHDEIFANKFSVLTVLAVK